MTALIDEGNRAQRERQSHEVAVTGAKNADEAFKLGAAHAAAAQAASDNRAAYHRGIASAQEIGPAFTPERITAGIAARVARRAANAKGTNAPVAAKTAPPATRLPPTHAVAAPTPVAAEVPAPVVGDFTLRARKYHNEQLAKGNRISMADAVQHVSNT